MSFHIKKAPKLEFTIGPADAGWCSFAVRLENVALDCMSSWIGEYPAEGLIYSAVDLYDHIFVNSLPIENAVWDIQVADEPGGIFIRATPVEKQVRLRVYFFEGEPLWPTPEKRPEVSPVFDECLDYWEYADAVFRAVAITLATQGLTGLRDGWAPMRWGADDHFQIFPMEHFLFLAHLVRKRRPLERGMTLSEELDLLRELLAEFGTLDGEGADR